MKKANKQEMELRAGFAADLLAQGHSCSVVTTQVIEEHALSRRQVRRISAKAMHLIIQDFEEINIMRLQISILLGILKKVCNKDYSTTNQVVLRPVQDK